MVAAPAASYSPYPFSVSNKRTDPPSRALVSQHLGAAISGDVNSGEGASPLCWVSSLGVDATQDAQVSSGSSTWTRRLRGKHGPLDR